MLFLKAIYDDDEVSCLIYELNRYGKIVVNSNEVYYGCIVSIEEKTRIAKLYVIDWRDRDVQPKHFQTMIVPFENFTIKYFEGDFQ